MALYGSAAATELLHAAATADGARRCCCDGVAAATELRRAAPSRSFCASRLSDATRRVMSPAFIFPGVDLNLQGRGPQS